jgi:hypothetical protein
MKVGDLVQFKKAFRGLGNLVGTIIAENGKGFDILWSVPVDPPFGQGAAARIQAELPEFLEVCNETR